MKFKIFLLGLVISFGFNIQSVAQSYAGSMAINIQDTSFLTASFLSGNNELITASLAKKVVPPGGTGFPDMMSVGQLALRKLDAQGQQIWEVNFMHSAARITHVNGNDNGDIIISGGFRDSLQFQNGQTYYAEQFRLNAFIASYTSQGVFNWAHVTGADANYSKYYYNFDIYNNHIYAPFYEASNTSTNLHVLNMQGDSVNDITFSDGALLISEMEFDATGNLYICGTGDSYAKISGSILGIDSTLGYISFIAKLDATFQQEWSYSYEYISIDFYPQMAINQNTVAFIVDTIPQPNGIGNFHQLTFYSLSGTHLGRDSIGGGVFNNLHGNIALESFGDKFVFVGLQGWDTLVIKSVDTQFQYQNLTYIDLESYGAAPFFVSNDSLLLFNHSFMDSMARVNDSDFIFNPKHTAPFYTHLQQMIVRFELGQTPVNARNISKETGNTMHLYPNPSSGNVSYLKFESTIEQESYIRILSINGTILLEDKIDIGQDSYRLDLESFSDGLYFVQVQNDNSSWVKKLILTK